eukprot:1154750-Pelagomonas_calceolata.AAC.3
MGDAPLRHHFDPLQTLNGPGLGREIKKKRNAMGRTKKPHSVGEYKPSLKQGVSNKFQASWLQENERHLWLEDCGMDADGVFKAGIISACSCTRCYASCSAVAKPLLLLPDQAAAVTAAVTTVARVGAAAQTSRSQHERSKLQSLRQWQAELLNFGHS